MLGQHYGSLSAFARVTRQAGPAQGSVDTIMWLLALVLSGLHISPTGGPNNLMVPESFFIVFMPILISFLPLVFTMEAVYSPSVHAFRTRPKSSLFLIILKE